MHIIKLFLYRINPRFKPKITNRGDFLVLTKEQLSELKKAEIESADHKALYDVKKLNLNISENIINRSQRYFGMVRNPYTFKVGSTGVKVNFGSGKSFWDSMMDVVTSDNCH